MAITPPMFTFLEAQPNSPVHFIASVSDGGTVQIAGRGHVWATSIVREEAATALPGVYRTPGRAAAALARHDLVPYTHAEAYCSFRERAARKRVAGGGLGVNYSYHTPPPPVGFSLSTDWSGSQYRFYASAGNGAATAVVSGRGTRWASAVTDVAGRSDFYGAEWVTPEEAAAAIAGSGHELSTWKRAAEQMADHPETIPLVDEHGDTLWVVDREGYYRLGDLSRHVRDTPTRSARTQFRVLR